MILWETGDIKWTVNASKGAVVSRTDKVATITVTRGEGIDSIAGICIYMVRLRKTVERVEFRSVV